MSVQLGSLKVFVSDESAPPIRPDVRVFEEDTFTILSAPPEIPDVAPHPIRVMTGVLEAKPKQVGQIIEVNRRQWLLVVHDLEREPSTTPEILRSMLEAVLTRAESVGVTNLAVPLLGAQHGPLEVEAAAQMLAEAFAARWFHSLKRVWVIAEPERVERVQQIFEESAI